MKRSFSWLPFLFPFLFTIIAMFFNIGVLIWIVLFQFSEPAEETLATPRPEPAYHKAIDPDNHNVIYMFPDGYTGFAIPGHYAVPSLYAEKILTDYYQNSKAFNSEAIPDDWHLFITLDPVPNENFD